MQFMVRLAAIVGGFVVVLGVVLGTVVAQILAGVETERPKPSMEKPPYRTVPVRPSDHCAICGAPRYGDKIYVV